MTTTCKANQPQPGLPKAQNTKAPIRGRGIFEIKANENINNEIKIANEVVNDISDLIVESRKSVTQIVNSAMTLLCWKIGKRINEEILQGERADYGKPIVATLSQQLVFEFGSSFTEKNLRRMVQLNQYFPDEQIVVSLIRQLSWTHFIALIPIEDPLKREFYI